MGRNSFGELKFRRGAALFGAGYYSTLSAGFGYWGTVFSPGIALCETLSNVLSDEPNSSYLSKLEETWRELALEPCLEFAERAVDCTISAALNVGLKSLEDTFVYTRIEPDWNMDIDGELL